MRKHKRVEFGSSAYGSSFKIGRQGAYYSFISSAEISAYEIRGFSSEIS